VEVVYGGGGVYVRSRVIYIYIYIYNGSLGPERVLTLLASSQSL
jgi:hypothetical protein